MRRTVLGEYVVNGFAGGCMSDSVRSTLGWGCFAVCWRHRVCSESISRCLGRNSDLNGLFGTTKSVSKLVPGNSDFVFSGEEVSGDDRGRSSSATWSHPICTMAAMETNVENITMILEVRRASMCVNFFHRASTIPPPFPF